MNKNRLNLGLCPIKQILNNDNFSSEYFDKNTIWKSVEVSRKLRIWGRVYFVLKTTLEAATERWRQKMYEMYCGDLMYSGNLNSELYLFIIQMVQMPCTMVWIANYLNTHTQTHTLLSAIWPLRGQKRWWNCNFHYKIAASKIIFWVSA